MHTFATLLEIRFSHVVFAHNEIDSSVLGQEVVRVSSVMTNAHVRSVLPTPCDGRGLEVYLATGAALAGSL